MDSHGIQLAYQSYSNRIRKLRFDVRERARLPTREGARARRITPGRRTDLRERDRRDAGDEPDARASRVRPARGRGPAAALPAARRARRAGLGPGDRGG